ncbi:MAG: M24 family metallopeptidase, partial [Dehalococcoidia bacterium]
EMHYGMAKAGGEEAAIRSPVSREGMRMPHKPSTRLKVEAGEMVFADICGVFNRFHADLCRFFSLREPSNEVRERMEVLARSLPWVIEAVKPGDPTMAIGEAIDKYVESAGLKGLVARGGYDLGISIPPDWVGHTRVASGGFVDVKMAPGFVTNYEVFSADPKVPDLGFIDTLLMTERGLEVLSKIPQEVLVAG